jgi:hypothetical protein
MLEAMEGFEATAGLEAGALQALLVEGRPEERVWAAWRIALRVGGAMPEIVAHVAGEPSPGVRRALLVILAGHREYDVLVALARHDPAIAVRAHAMQMITALAAQGAIPMIVVTEGHRAGPTEIRCAILRGVSAGAPELLRELVVNGLGASAADEQVEAFDAALRDGDPALRAIALRWLGRASDAIADEAWRVVLGLPRDELIEELRRRDVMLDASRIAPLLWAPLETLGALVRDDDTGAFAALRDHPGFREASTELCVRAVLSNCVFGYVERLIQQAETHELAQPDRLVAYLTHRIDELARGVTLPDERRGRGWLPERYYRRLLALLRSSRG